MTLKLLSRCGNGHISMASYFFIGFQTTFQSVVIYYLSSSAYVLLNLPIQSIIDRYVLYMHIYILPLLIIGRFLIIYVSILVHSKWGQLTYVLSGQFYQFFLVVLIYFKKLFSLICFLYSSASIFSHITSLFYLITFIITSLFYHIMNFL